MRRIKCEGYEYYGERSNQDYGYYFCFLRWLVFFEEFVTYDLTNNNSNHECGDVHGENFFSEGGICIKNGWNKNDHHDCTDRFGGKEVANCLSEGYISISIQNSEGQKGSFKCSQTDSLTAEKEPTIGFVPEKSKVRCRAVPSNIMKSVPAISKVRTFLFFTMRFHASLA